METMCFLQPTKLLFIIYLEESQVWRINLSLYNCFCLPTDSSTNIFRIFLVFYVRFLRLSYHNLINFISLINMWFQMFRMKCSSFRISLIINRGPVFLFNETTKCGILTRAARRAMDVVSWGDACGLSIYLTFCGKCVNCTLCHSAVESLQAKTLLCLIHEPCNGFWKPRLPLSPTSFRHLILSLHREQTITQCLVCSHTNLSSTVEKIEINFILVGCILLRNVYITLSDIYLHRNWEIFLLMLSFSISQHVSALSGHPQVNHNILVILSYESHRYFNGSVVRKYVLFTIDFLGDLFTILFWLNTLINIIRNNG
jgi:hypothetical protein